MSSGPFSTPGGGFVHPLLRARDWQDRPEFQALCQWWKDGGVGVCALVGIGGAGKTAIAERFLQVLPGGYPEHPKVLKDRSLAAPAWLFVFSFYDAPNPDTFFTEFGAWLEGCSPAPREEASADGVHQPLLYYKIVKLLVEAAKAGRCLLVLDGLEKVQDDSSRGGALGRILDGRLRDLVLGVADRWFSQVSLVITSRFRLFDPPANRADYYLQLEVAQLHLSAAVQLLRDRGVRGADEQLKDIAREQGFHALSIDLVGGYIALFCGGEPQRFSSLILEPAEVTNPALDPRIAAIREQERKFARLAERYHQALAKSDPASLALLQRVCLFRLGVEAKTLASIFTGKGKENIAGAALASLDEQQLQSKLQFLVEIRLVEASKSQIPAHKSHQYTVHPAVRDGFLKTLDAETTRLGHNAASAALRAELGGLPSRGSKPPDAAMLDLLEEIIYHNIAAGLAQEAWDIYWNWIGGYRSLGWRMGEYDRGERICRAFVAGQSPHTAPLPAGLPEYRQGIFINEWALYLKGLGQLVVAARCHESHIEMAVQKRQWLNASIGNHNLADTLLLSGRLTSGFLAAKEALRLADELARTATEKFSAHAFCGQMEALRGNLQIAFSHFRYALEQKSRKVRELPLRSIWYANSMELFALIGRSNEAIVNAATVDRESAGVVGVEQHANWSRSNLLLATIAGEQGDLTTARELMNEACEWALQRDARELLCWSALVRAKIELSAFREQRTANQSTAQACLAHVASALEEGLRIARNWGYGIYHIDLLLVRAQLALHEGRAADAEQDVYTALNEGIHPPAESSFSELLAATDPECLYAWGIAEGHHLRAEALLLQAAQKLGQAEFVPKRLDRLPADVRDLIDRAREEINQALELWRKLKDPESEADINPRGERTKRVLEGLDGGILTEYPLKPLRSVEPAASPETPEAERKTKPVPKKKHVFLSYCRDNRADVATLHDELVAAGEAVWWDQDILPGQDWKLEIRRAMRDAYAVVLCLSEETADRITSGIYPEVLDAIAAYREYAPGSVFLIPVRLSDCEIPLIEIDATRTLDRLQFVDLFPPAQRAAGLGRLLNALQAAPHHP